MPALTNLKGTSGKPVEVRIFKTVAQAMKFAREDRATTSAGDNGAINVWIDNFGIWRTSFHRRLATLDERSHANQKSVREWLKTNIPAMN